MALSRFHHYAWRGRDENAAAQNDVTVVSAITSLTEMIFTASKASGRFCGFKQRILRLTLSVSLASTVAAVGNGNSNLLRLTILKAGRVPSCNGRAHRVSSFKSNIEPTSSPQRRGNCWRRTCLPVPTCSRPSVAEANPVRTPFLIIHSDAPGRDVSVTNKFGVTKGLNEVCIPGSMGRGDRGNYRAPPTIEAIEPVAQSKSCGVKIPSNSSVSGPVTKTGCPSQFTKTVFTALVARHVRAGISLSLITSSFIAFSSDWTSRSFSGTPLDRSLRYCATALSETNRQTGSASVPALTGSQEKEFTNIVCRMNSAAATWQRKWGF